MTRKKTMPMTSHKTAAKPHQPSDVQDEGKAEAAESTSPQEADAAANESETPQQSLEEKLQAEREAAEKESAANYEKYLRIAAEFDNFKKRHAREMEEFRKFAHQSFAKDLLVVVDNLERAIESSAGGESGLQALREGVTLTREEILRVLEKYDVTPIKAVGQPFDPRYHEAVLREETDAYPENTVVSEIQRGYMIKDRLLRPCMVTIAAGGARDRERPQRKETDSNQHKPPTDNSH